MGFAERLLDLSSTPLSAPLSLLFLDVNFFAEVNNSVGRVVADAVLRWIGIILLEETQADVYRLGGDEFVAILERGEHHDHELAAKHIYDRFNNEAAQFGLRAPVASVTLIQYRLGDKLTSGDFLVHLGTAILDVKESYQRAYKLFRMEDLAPTADRRVVEWIANLTLQRLVILGWMLDEAHHLAYTDAVTGLPNMRAAEDQLLAVLEQAREQNTVFTVLLADGDDLREYNKISYAAGDEMIRRLSDVLRAGLRPSDFLARWRVGDEFLAILYSTSLDQAITVAERLVRQVDSESRSWEIPITISIGVAAYPGHGRTVEELIAHAERANAKAKDLGKNQVVSEL